MNWVPASRLAEDLWGGEPPAGAASTLQSHISFLRGLLGPGHLQGRDGGYVIQVADEGLDIWLFESECRQGRDALAAGDLTRASEFLSQSLARWRGSALVDVDGASWAVPEQTRLEELRLGALEAWIEALLVSGDDQEAVAAAEAAVASHPLREGLWAHLMLGLYRSGRQADALRAYQRLRKHLGEELGIEPSGELVSLEEAIVLHKPELDWIEPSTIAPAGATRKRPRPLEGDRVPLPPRLVPETTTRFVGRRTQQQLLETAWKQATEGDRRVTFIGGEPGIGKTSLASDLARKVFEQGALVLYGRCDEDLGIPYQPWVEALGHLVRYGPQSLLDDHIQTRIAELARLVPELSDRTGVAVSGAVADESERYLLFGAVSDLLVRCSELAPTLLVLDDLHWADRPTLQLVRHVITRNTDVRLCIIGTFRDSEVGAGHPLADALAGFHREAGVERLTLGGLGDHELLALLESYAGHEISEDAVHFRNALLEETGGNPFFVGEIVRHLVETGAISQGEHGRWEAKVNLVASGLPVSVREVIGHRVGRLGRSAAQWLTMAAVIGRDFDLDLLANVIQIDHEDLLVVLESAVQAGILVESETPGRFAFAHALFEHSLYRDMTSLRRARAHRAVAEAIEDQCGEELTGRVGELAYHWAHATEPQELHKAVEYARLAGARALQQLAPDEAIRWYSDTLEMLDRQSPPNNLLQASLLVDLGDAQRQMGDPNHRDTLLKAARLADEAGDTATLVPRRFGEQSGLSQQHRFG